MGAYSCIMRELKIVNKRPMSLQASGRDKNFSKGYY